MKIVKPALASSLAGDLPTPELLRRGAGIWGWYGPPSDPCSSTGRTMASACGEAARVWSLGDSERALQISQLVAGSG